MKKKLQFYGKCGSFYKIILLTCALIMGSLQTYSQNTTEKKITINKTNAPLVEVLYDVQKQSGYNFAYEKSQLENFAPVTIKAYNAPLNDVLDMIFGGTNFSYKIVDNKIAIVRNVSVAPQTKIFIKGRVVDDKGNAIPGAAVKIHNTTKGTASDSRGRFSIEVRPGDVLLVSCIGYVEQLVLVKDKKEIEIKLKPSVEQIDEISVVAFGEQKKESMVASITSVKPAQLKSSNSDLTASFAGNVAGMIAWQTGGIPGALTEGEMNTKFYIRGITSFQSKANIDPLILLDGVESSKLDLARIDPEDIESLNVMKDASATAMYGARGANGVIYVTTKKGKAGSVYTSVRYEAIASMPTSEIDVVDPITYMKLYNETLLQRNADASPKYSTEKINNTGSSRFPDFVYPANDWYKILFKPMTVNHHMGLNIRGGSDVVQYYSSLNYNEDNGMIKTDRLNQFKCNIKNRSFSFRTNLNIDLSKGIKLVVNSFSTLDKYHGPLQDLRQAYNLAFRGNPVDFAATYPADDFYKWDHIRFGSSDAGANPYAKIHEGYNDRMRYSTINRVEYIQNLSFVAKGLEFRASASLNQEGYFSTSFKTTPAMYALQNYDFATGKHTLRALNGSGSRVLDPQPKQAVSTAQTRIAGDVTLMHTAAWGNHQTGITAVLSAQEITNAMQNSLFKSFPKRNLGLSARGTYGFKDRYFVEGSFGYNGSERFAKNHRMGFFPALGGSWIVSKEQFMKSTENWLTFLKVRVSWGKVGNDGIIDDPRYVHLSEIVEDNVIGPVPNSFYSPAYIIKNNKNPKISWEIAEQSNLGIDFKLFDGIIEINADIYREIRHNVLDYRTTIPASLGLLVPAYDNVGKAKSQGLDLSAKIQHAFKSDFWFILNGTFTYSKAEFMKLEEATNKPAWQVRKGREISQQFGYIAEGLFQDQFEIDNAPFQGGMVQPGDIRYRDINNDRKIDAYDAVPIGYPETPRIIYGFNAFLHFKGVELNLAFQGAGNRSFFIDPKQISPLYGDNAVLEAIYQDHWTSENASNRPFWPRMSIRNIVEHNPQEDYYSTAESRKSTYFMKNGSFIRCKTIELGYNLPEKFVKKIALKNIKVYVRANNPFVASSFDVWDVELGTSGFNYPIQKSYSCGINVNF